MTANALSINVPEQLGLNQLKRKRSKKKLSRFLECLSVTQNSSIEDIFQCSFATKTEKNLRANAKEVSRDFVLPISSNKQLSQPDDTLLHDAQKVPMVEVSLNSNKLVPCDDSASKNQQTPSLISVPKSEIESKTKKNTNLNSEYSSNVRLILKPIFLDQPRPSSPIIGPSSFLTVVQKPNVAEDGLASTNKENSILTSKKDFTSTNASIKWSKDLVSFDAKNLSNPQKPALKKCTSSFNSLNTVNDTNNEKTSNAKAITVQEFVYSDDSPIAVTALLTTIASSRYSDVSVDEFLSNISTSSTFKLSNFARRRLQISRKIK